MSSSTILFSAIVLSFLLTGAAYAQEPGCQLALTSEPKGAEVIIRDSSGEGFVGKTPYYLSDCTPGVYQISIALEGYETWSASLSVEPGRAYLLPTVVLERIQAPARPSEGGAAYTEPSLALTPPLVEESAAPVPVGKSPGAALGLSVGLTAASYGLFVGGLAVVNEGSFGTGLLLVGVVAVAAAPSAGHFYAGEWRHGLLTSSLRLSAPLVGRLVGDALEDRIVSIAVGVVGFLGLTLYDLIDSPLSASRHNKKLLLSKKKASFSLVPAPLVSPDGDTNLGLFAVGSF